MNYYFDVLRKYAVFNGRAPRAEYWWFVLFNVLISIAIGIVGRVIGIADNAGNSIISMLYTLAVMIPSLAVSVRRLHDTNRSGWWLLLAFIPCIGSIVLLVFMIQEGTGSENDYGPDPNSYTVNSIR